MNIGYACQTIGVPGTKQRTCMMKNANPDVLRNLIQSNLEAFAESKVVVQSEVKTSRADDTIRENWSLPGKRKGT